MSQKLVRRFIHFFRSWKNTFKFFLIALLVIFLVAVSSRFVNFARKNKLSPSFVTNILLSNDLQLKKTDGRTNILLLGIPGKNHEGIDLTDTLIFISINSEKNKVVLSSLPRDIWLDSLKDKINTAYHYGEQKKEGGGFILAKSAVSEIVGEPVHYVLLIDFDGFKRLIDLVGGIDVNVDQSFTDEKFPLVGRENDECDGTDPEFKCRYETIHFDQGITHMDGEIALKFVRSRNSTGHQGTDFARSERQKNVLLALKDKLVTLDNLSPQKIKQLTGIYTELVSTDLAFTEGAYLAKYALKFSGEIKNIVLEAETEEKEGILINPPVEKYGRWVLIPKAEDFSEIHKLIKCNLEDIPCP